MTMSAALVLGAHCPVMGRQLTISANSPPHAPAGGTYPNAGASASQNTCSQERGVKATTKVSQEESEEMAIVDLLEPEEDLVEQPHAEVLDGLTLF